MKKDQTLASLRGQEPETDESLVRNTFLFSFPEKVLSLFCYLTPDYAKPFLLWYYLSNVFHFKTECFIHLSGFQCPFVLFHMVHFGIQQYYLPKKIHKNVASQGLFHPY